MLQNSKTVKKCIKYWQDFAKGCMIGHFDTIDTRAVNV